MIVRALSICLYVVCSLCPGTVFCMSLRRDAICKLSQCRSLMHQYRKVLSSFYDWMLLLQLIFRHRNDGDLGGCVAHDVFVRRQALLPPPGSQPYLNSVYLIILTSICLRSLSRISHDITRCVRLITTHRRHLMLLQYWRLLTHHLACTNSSVLLLTELLLYNVGINIERQFGSVKFAVRNILVRKIAAHPTLRSPSSQCLPSYPPRYPLLC